MHIFKDLTMHSEYLSYSYPVAALAMIPYLFSHCPAAFRKRIVKRMSYVFFHTKIREYKKLLTNSCFFVLPHSDCSLL